MASLPVNLALGNIADGANIVAADHRTNYSSIQTYVNALNAILGAGANGQLLSSQGGNTISWVYPPGYEVVAPQVYTTDQTTTSTSYTDLFTFPAGTFEAAKYYLEIVIPNLRASIASDSIQFRLMEGAVQLGNSAEFETHVTAGLGVAAVYRMAFTPTAAAHTYKVQWLTVFAATATIKATIGDASFRIVKA